MHTYTEDHCGVSAVEIRMVVSTHRRHRRAAARARHLEATVGGARSVRGRGLNVLADPPGRDLAPPTDFQPASTSWCQGSKHNMVAYAPKRDPPWGGGPPNRRAQTGCAKRSRLPLQAVLLWSVAGLCSSCRRSRRCLGLLAHLLRVRTCSKGKKGALWMCKRKQRGPC